MRRYLVRRLFQFPPLLLGVSAVAFALGKFTPGDFVTPLELDPLISQATLDAIRHRYGLDQPAWLQYLAYLRNLVLHGDLGPSYSWHLPVARVLLDALGNTLLLAATGAAIAWAVAVPIGAWCAAHRHGVRDHAVSFASFVSMSMPATVAALLLLFVAGSTDLFPVGGMRSLHHERLSAGARALDVLHHLVLPAVTVAASSLGSHLRQMRACTIDVLGMDYIVTARAKGADDGAIVFRHALRNALNPMLSLFGLTIGSLLSAALVAEVVFGWPGLGRVTLDAVARKDQFLVVGAVMVSAWLLAAGNLIADLLLAATDPRIRDSAGGS